MQNPILELRVAVTTSDYERLVKFYCLSLGVEPAAIWNNGDGKAMMLNMGQATLEIFDENQRDIIDELEVGQKNVSGKFRFALQVPNIHEAMKRFIENGATLVHEPITTPWGDINVRIQDPEGMQITLYQVSKQNNS